MIFDPKLATEEDRKEAARLLAYFGVMPSEEACLRLAIANRMKVSLELKIMHQRGAILRLQARLDAQKKKPEVEAQAVLDELRNRTPLCATCGCKVTQHAPECVAPRPPGP